MNSPAHLPIPTTADLYTGPGTTTTTFTSTHLRCRRYHHHHYHHLRAPPGTSTSTTTTCFCRCYCDAVAIFPSFLCPASSFIISFCTFLAINYVPPSCHSFGFCFYLLVSSIIFITTFIFFSFSFSPFVFVHVLFQTNLSMP